MKPLLILFAGSIVFFIVSGAIGRSGNKTGIGILSKQLQLETVSTGSSSMSLSEGKPGEFLEHRFGAGRFGNMLYQGFVAFHFDEDSLVVRNSPYGRTVNTKFPGDLNELESIQRDFFEDDEKTVATQTYSFKDLTNRVRIIQTLQAAKDSSNGILLRFVLELARRGNDSTFSNVSFMFGYDGDIGTTTGGYADDSTGTDDDPANPLIYVFDDSLNLYSGMRLMYASAPAFVANRALWHQEINAEGRTKGGADSLALAVMKAPQFASGLGNTDVSLFVTMTVGSVTVLDTLRDTLELLLMNGTSLDDISGLPKKLQTGITRDPGIVSVEDFELGKNFPNPFNPATRIELVVGKYQTFQVDVFNALGQRVRKLHHGPLSAGRQVLLWDGRNDGGREVASGVYILRVRGHQSVRHSKMLLVR